MKENKYRLLVPGIIFLVLLSFSFTPVDADSSESEDERFRELLMGIDGKIRALRFDRDISREGIEELDNKFDNLFPEGSVDSDLRNEIKSTLSEFKDNTSKVTIDRLRNLRGKIEELAESKGIELSFVYEYAVLVILGVSVSLAFVVNLISRVFVNWEEVNEAKRKQSEIKDELKKAKEANDTKKAHKLQKKQQQFMQENMGTMFSPMKTMLIIIIPFMIVFSVMRGTYGGWAVAWLPFNFPWLDIGLPFVSRFFEGTMASLGFFGWYILSYFGFSQILRNLLVPSE